MKPKKLIIKDCRMVMPFGQYKGQSIEVILACHPDYIVWLDSLNNVEVDEEILGDAQIMMDADEWDDAELGHNYSSYYDDD